MNLTQILTYQVYVVHNHFVSQADQGDRHQPNASIPTSRIWDFMRMNPPTFHGTKVDEDLQGFINEVFKVVDAIGMNPREKAELTTYQLKDATQVCFEQLRSERPLERGPVDWEEFKEAFLYRFFPLK